MYTIDSFYASFGKDASANVGLSMINPKEFFRDPRGVLWKQEMLNYIQERPEIRFNRGMFKAHIIALAVDYHRNQKVAKSDEIGRYIQQKTTPGQFTLKPGEPGYEEESVESVAFDILRMIAVFFLNVVTLGMASLFWMKKNNQRIAHLKDEGKSLKEFQKEQVRRLGRVTPTIQEILSVANDRKKKSSEIKNQNGENRKILNKLIQEKNKIEELIEESIYIQEDESTIPVPTPLNKNTLKVEPLYQRKESDKGKIDERFSDINKIKLDENGNYLEVDGEYVGYVVVSEPGKHVNHKKTMESLLDSVFDWGIGILTNKGGIAFTNSAPDQLALCKFMVYLMIDTAKVETSCFDQISRLVLNNEELKVASSVEVYRVPKKDKSGFEILYKNWDAWSPRDPNQFPRGIDPVAVKWIITRFANDNNFLRPFYTQLLNPFLNGNIDKIEEIIKAVDPQKPQNDATLPEISEIDLANQLIEDIARGLMDRYQAIFARKIQKLNNGKDILAEVEDVSMIEASSEEESPSHDISIEEIKNPVVEKTWINSALSETLKKSENFLNVLAKRAKDLIPGDDFTVNLPTDTNKFLTELRKSFDVIHINIHNGESAHHGSLFSALTFALLQGATDKSEINPAAIRGAMANYLGLNKDAWKEKILIHTKKLTGAKSDGYTVDQYLAWLRGEKPDLDKKTQTERKDEDANLLEIELAAATFGIQIDLIVKGQLLSKKEGVFQAESSYGPKTEEKIYLLNTLEAPSFKALSPKLRESSDDLDVEAKNAIQHHAQFFTKNSDQRLKTFLSAWKHFAI